MGYKFFYDKKYPDIGRVCITERNTKYLKYEKFLPEKADYYNAYPYADLYQTSTKEKNSVVVMYGPQCRFSMDTVYPLTRIKLYDLEVKAPHNYTQYLTQLYGPKFMDPPPNNLRTGHGAYSEACKNG
jgi:phosphorylcholine metabolism protein LicD